MVAFRTRVESRSAIERGPELEEFSDGLRGEQANQPPVLHDGRTERRRRPVLTVEGIVIRGNEVPFRLAVAVRHADVDVDVWHRPQHHGPGLARS